MKNGDKHILSGSSSVNMSTNMYENETLLTNRYATTGSFDSQDYDYTNHQTNDFLPMDTSSFDESDYHTVKSQSQYHKPPQHQQQQERKSLQTLFPIMEQDDESRSRTDMSSINEKERSPEGKSPSSYNISMINNNNKNHRNHKDNNNTNNNSRPGSRSTTPIPHWK
jgi:hypothetical protein